MKHRLSILIFFIIFQAHAHEKHHPSENQSLTENKIDVLKTINDPYVSTVKPIFEKKCFDCHSKFTKHPWYHKLPLVKTLLDRDIKEGLKHLDMGDDFPFKGHGSPKEDLEAIKKTLQKNEMPLWRYRLLHPGTKVTDEEKILIYQWIDQSLNLLSK